MDFLTNVWHLVGKYTKAGFAVFAVLLRDLADKIKKLTQSKLSNQIGHRDSLVRLQSQEVIQPEIERSVNSMSIWSKTFLLAKIILKRNDISFSEIWKTAKPQKLKKALTTLMQRELNQSAQARSSNAGFFHFDHPDVSEHRGMYSTSHHVTVLGNNVGNNETNGRRM